MNIYDYFIKFQIWFLIPRRLIIRPKESFRGIQKFEIIIVYNSSLLVAVEGQKVTKISQ